MRIIENNGLRILVPESSDFILYNVLSNSYHEKVYLGTADSVDNYREMDKALLNDNNKKVDELLDIINKQDAALTNLAQQLAELAKLMPSSNDEE